MQLFLRYQRYWQWALEIEAHAVTETGLSKLAGRQD